MFHGKVYRIICVRAAELNGDDGDIAIIDKFYFYGVCNLATITGGNVIDGRIGVIIGLAILSGWEGVIGIFWIGGGFHDSRYIS